MMGIQAPVKVCCRQAPMEELILELSRSAHATVPGRQMYVITDNLNISSAQVEIGAASSYSSPF